jgi:hypothetical protein
MPCSSTQIVQGRAYVSEGITHEMRNEELKSLL